MGIRSYYNASLADFLAEDTERLLGILTEHHHHALEEQQRWAWLQQIAILKAALADNRDGFIFLELYIPRMGKRADAVLLLRNVAFVIEFKVGALEHQGSAFTQVEDYALDLKNFHEGSHAVPIVPVLVSTHASCESMPEIEFADDLVSTPVGANASQLGTLINHICSVRDFPSLDIDEWMSKGYRPTPTIVEAAQFLYRTHNVSDISRSDAGAKNLQQTTQSINAIVNQARRDQFKAICFVTGVPGSGKTLAGLNIATQRFEEHRDEHAVFLSGNGPLVEVLREALARDKASREDITKKVAEREVRSFVQNIHHFRDEYLREDSIPIERVVVFDEAQRAWNREQATSFMQRKRGRPNFNLSEPEFLISVMDRHTDWCVIVCLVGGGQEINTGEAGISEWIRALAARFPTWRSYISPRILLPEYGSAQDLRAFFSSPRTHLDENLHLAVSMRSFRAEALSELVDNILANEPNAAKLAYERIASTYPFVLTRDLSVARVWLRNRSRGTERFGLVASSGAQRLRPEGIHIKAEIEPANWFLNDDQDVRSSNYLEDVASEFAVQGLELDWAGVCWDGDFYYRDGSWNYQSFKGTKWQSIRDKSRQLYLRNAYRVILTRARQGMIIFVPKGDALDSTRPPAFYDDTFEYLRSCGIPVLG